MIEPCVLIHRGGLDNWCENHHMYHNGPSEKWAVGEDDISIRWRQIWDNLRNGIRDHTLPEIPEPLPYTTAELVNNYLQTLAAHKAGGSLMVPDHVRQQRREVCDGCDLRDKETDSCKICKCSLSPTEIEATLIGDKLRWAVAKCPAKKWSEWEDDKGYTRTVPPA